MSTTSLLISILLVFVSYTIHSQNSEKTIDSLNTEKTQLKPTTLQLLKYDGLSIYKGIKNTYTRPFKWKKKDWITFGGILAGTGILLTVDKPANTYFTEQSDEIPNGIKETGFRFGKPLLNYGLTTSVYAIGLFTKNENIRKTGVLLIASATAGGLIQTVSKTLAGRARPNTGKGNLSFHFWSDEPGFHSFPSGHSILSFTTAYAIGKQFNNPYLKGGIYAIGLLSPVSRLWAGAHWLTDVGLGIAISIVIVDGIDNYLKKTERYVYQHKQNKIKWNLKLGAGQIGVVGRF
ncbi:phosphatase PAP2 family protein [Aquimarina longa]|uniref:phosphatase PAP2 family protein n=1 Tax=Aquimarina longa TaxID=1080221 RepID=UPI000785CB19|nr:phosphatase PAP2 family protein [Aquimarina longa]